MRKTICIFLLIVLCLLSGCGTDETEKWKPDVVSSEIRNYAERALEIVDKYLSFNIDAKEMERLLQELYDRMDGLSEENENLADMAAYFAIGDLRFNGETYSDKTIRFFRDVLQFSLGKEVSGKTFDPLLDVIGYEEDENKLVREKLHLQNYPVMSASAFALEGEYSIFLDFEAATGVSPEEALQYCVEIYEKSQSIRSEYDVKYFLATYAIYGQTAFYISGNSQTEDANDYTIYISFANESIELENPSSTDTEEIAVKISQYISDYIK